MTQDSDSYDTVWNGDFSPIGQKYNKDVKFLLLLWAKKGKLYFLIKKQPIFN